MRIFSYKLTRVLMEFFTLSWRLQIFSFNSKTANCFQNCVELFLRESYAVRIDSTFWFLAGGSAVAIRYRISFLLIGRFPATPLRGWSLWFRHVPRPKRMLQLFAFVSKFLLSVFGVLCWRDFSVKATLCMYNRGTDLVDPKISEVYLQQRK